MNLWFRLLLTLLLSRRRAPCDLARPCYTPFRVLPTDLDALMHVNNGVYLSLMDLGRVDFMIRTGTFPQLSQRRWYPVMAAETIQFHSALLPFQSFFIETRWAGWDERTFFVQQRFLRHRVDGELVAEAWVRGVMARRAGGTVPMSELLSVVGEAPQPEPLPRWVSDWAHAMDAGRTKYKETRKAG